MIKEDNLYLAKDAQTRLMSGISRTAQAIGATMGTSGSNILIEAIERPGFLSSNDGFYSANSIFFKDPLEDLGRKILIEAINRANRASGDGSSTTTVLCAAILEEGFKHIGKASPMEIKRSLEACIPLIEESVKSQKKDVTVDTVAAVASISAEDEEIGNRIQEIYQKIGPKGVIQWDISKTPEDSYSISAGLTIHGATYVSRYMCELTDQGFTNQVRLENPRIILAKKKITSITDLDPIFEKLFKQEIKEVVVFVEDIDSSVVNGLIAARKSMGFRAVVIKMPVLWADEWWEDLALATGATLIDAASGIKMRNLQLENLGTVGHLNVDKEDTQIDGIKDLNMHIMSLQADGSDQALQRAERLNTQTARYFVGAHSESALAYRRLKVEDAINAAHCALENGVVAGGGVALFNASKTLKSGIGKEILSKALEAPLRQIVRNAGANEDDIVASINVPKNVNGYDTKTNKIVNMEKAGIIDPTDVVLNSVKSAIGVAASILTIGTVILLPRDDVQKA